MAYTHENRPISLQTPLGEDVLLLAELKGTEAISSLFSFELNLLSENNNISFDQIVGKSVTVSIDLADGNERHFNGIISRFSQGRAEGEVGAELRFWRYRATMTPWLWLLTRTANSRIFQNLSVPEILQEIFNEKGLPDFRLQLQESYKKREYCVQYMETDFDFVSRLMEEEGIYYYFEHDDRKHVMVIADSLRSHPTLGAIRHELAAGGFIEEDVITGLEKVQEMRPGKFSLSDYNFETPRTGLEVNRPSQHQLGPGEREVFEYPGGYMMKAEGDRLVKIRMQEEESQITIISGTSNCRAFTSGYRFTLSDFYRQDMNNKDHALRFVNHQASQSWNGDTPFSYENAFTCIPIEVPYRPQRITPKPLIHGTQTALVVGPSGEEIYTDKYGRVKVQFHWDRKGNRDEKSSCWIRVCQPSAGASYGGMFIPRIGHEVVVDFLEGDPDRPLVIGCVYNGNNMPAYGLPDMKTRSTLRSCSSKGGGGYNEIRFEDKKDDEQMFIHAQKDKHIYIHNDLDQWVGHDSHQIIKEHQFELVEGNKHLIVRTDRNEKVNNNISLQAGINMQEKVGMNYALDAGMEIHLKAGMNVVIEAGVQLTLKAGAGFITIDPVGVSISGPLVNINSGGAAGAGSGCSPTEPEEAKEGDSGDPPP